MADILQALSRSVATLARPRVWLLLLGPMLVALLLWLGLTFVLLDNLVAWFVEFPPLTWLSGWGAVWLAHVLAAAGGWVVILAATYLTAMLLAAIFVLPLLLKEVADRDYPDLARRGSDSLIGSVWNSVAAALVFVAGWLLTMPLWLIPGLALLLPLLWMAWLNRRTFAYDTLAVHAGDDEWQTLRRGHSGRLFGLGLVLALLGHVPVLGLLAPTMAALAYVHYCLEALRRLRGGAVVTVIGEKAA